MAFLSNECLEAIYFMRIWLLAFKEKGKKKEETFRFLANLKE